MIYFVQKLIYYVKMSAEFLPFDRLVFETCQLERIGTLDSSKSESWHHVSGRLFIEV